MDKAGEGKVPGSRRTTRQETGGTIKTEGQVVQEEGALGREMGKSSGDEMGDKGEALGGIV